MRLVGKLTVVGFAAFGAFTAVGLSALILAHYPWSDD